MDFLVLLFAHMLADHPLQGQFLATEKGRNIILLVSHAIIWTGCIVIVGHLLGYTVNLFDVFFLFIVHTIADYLKAKNLLFYKKFHPLHGGLLIDQLIHVGQILFFLLTKNI